jgi:hypothetical protein
MKNFLIGLTVFACVVGFFGILQHNESIYNRVVTVINHKDNTTLCVDSQGNLWEYNDCIGNKGDTITLKMFDNHTDSNIYDDIILGVK